MNQCPPGPQVFHWGRFEFFGKFGEIFTNELTPAITCLAVSTTPAKNVSPMSTTPAINPCHGEITKKGTFIYEKIVMSKILCQTPYRGEILR
jgi:hypothetical protein